MIKDRGRFALTERMFRHYREKTNVRKLAKAMAGYYGFAKVHLRFYSGRKPRR